MSLGIGCQLFIITGIWIDIHTKRTFVIDIHIPVPESIYIFYYCIYSLLYLNAWQWKQWAAYYHCRGVCCWVWGVAKTACIGKGYRRSCHCKIGPLTLTSSYTNINVSLRWSGPKPYPGCIWSRPPTPVMKKKSMRTLGSPPICMVGHFHDGYKDTEAEDLSYRQDIMRCCTIHGPIWFHFWIGLILTGVVVYLSNEY